MNIHLNGKNNERYIGEAQKMIRNGFGVYAYANKFFRYEGEWKQGKKHGHGKLLMGDGSYYEGQFTEGEITGHGYRFWSSTGNGYTGQFLNGELHGDGIMQYGDGCVFQGSWFQNMRQGHGVQQYGPDEVYEGEFYRNKRHGEGEMRYKDGSSYNGFWVADKKQGHGVAVFTDSSVYEGQFLNDLMNGEGEMRYISGLVYVGLWIHGKPAQQAAIIAVPSSQQVIECFQGECFNVDAQIQTAEGQLVEEESNRTLQISAGVRYVPRPDGGAPTPLLDIIEILEETPVETPFGFCIVPYPLTDQPNISRPAVAEPGTAWSSYVPPIAEEDGVATDVETSRTDTNPPIKSELGGPVDERVANPPAAATPPPLPPLAPPAPAPQKTTCGSVSWPELSLVPTLQPPAAPQGGSVSSTPVTGGAENSGSSTPSTGPDADPASQLKQPRIPMQAVGEDNYAKPGDYVLMIEDVTEPPCLGSRLPPAFVRLNLLPLPTAKKSGGLANPALKKRRWSTKQLIAQSMVE